MRMTRTATMVLIFCCLAPSAAAPRAKGQLPIVMAVDAPRIRSLARSSGARAILVNVWATWCVPCRKEFPALLRVAKAHRVAGLRLLLVSSDFPDQLPAARRFLRARGISDTSYIKNQDDQSFINAMDSSWTGTLPANFIFDAGGRLISSWEGESSEARFEREVRAALVAVAQSTKGKP